MRLIEQQVLDVLRVQFRSSGGSGNTAGSDQCHGRETALEFFDLGIVVAVGHQLPLLDHERVAVTLQAVDFHQLKAQLAALRLLLDALFQQRGGLVQATTVDVRLRAAQHVVGMLGGGRYQGCSNRRRDYNRGNHRGWSWRWSGCRGQFRGRRLDVQVLEDAFGQVKLAGELLFFGQGAGHAQVFFGFLLGFAATGQQQQQ
ncbi:hypothetical protein D9M71_611680 [compost metagenome]